MYEAGTVWLADLDPSVGREQSGIRPCIVVSGDRYVVPDMVIVVPVTSHDRGLPTQPVISSQSSGLKVLPSFARPEDVSARSMRRLGRNLGIVSPAELAAIRRVLRGFLGL